MAVSTGNDGSASLAGITATIDKFSVELDIDPIAIPPGLGEAWELSELGAGRITGTFSGKVTTTKAFTLSGSETNFTTSFNGTITLTMSSGRTIAGNAIYTQIRIEKDRAGYDRISGNFRNGSGGWVTA